MTDPVLITAATEEPISVSEAKAHCQIIDDTTEDALFPGWIAAAREYVEGLTGRALITSTWSLYLDGFPCDGADIKMPKGRLQSVASIKYTTTDGVEYTFDSEKYHVLTAREPGVIRLAYGESWPSDTLRTGEGVEITFDCGYADAATVPVAYKQAMILLVKWWHSPEGRSAAVVGNSASAVSAPIAFGVQALIDSAPKLWY